jgi:hypothetical protein
MDRRAGACGASFLPSWPSFQGLSSAFRTDSLVLPICDPLTGIIDAETRLASTKPRVVIKHRANLQSLRGSRPRKNRQGRLQRSRKAARTVAGETLIFGGLVADHGV